MNGNSFSLFGYLSVLLWIAVPLLWFMRKRSRWLCPAAFALALFALLFAKINSENHVNRIEPDRSAQMEAARAEAEAKSKAAAEARGEDVADIRFAEDDAGDFLDKAGMDEADLKYMDKLGDESEPEWKKAKKTRSGAGDDDGSLDAMLGGDEVIGGVKAEALEEKQEKPPILMSDADMAMAHRLDRINLNVIQALTLLAVLMLAVDYLGRANSYGEAFMPIPLPSVWRNAVTPIPPLVVRPTQARRDILRELEWLAKRGDNFVYLTDDPAAAAAVPTSLTRLGKKLCPVDVLRVDDKRINDEFVFESLWYGRSCFVVNSQERASQMLARIMELMEKRKKARARVRQTVHVVWDLKLPLSERESDNFTRLATATGFSFFACRPIHSTSQLS